MEKKQDSGLSCFMIVMKFHGIPITKDQAETLSVLDPEQKTGEIEIIESAKKLKMRAKLCKLNLKKLKDVKAPIIAKNKNDEFFIIAKSKEDKYMILFADKTQPEIKSREELEEIWDGTAILITKKGIMDREAVFSFKWFIPTILKFKKEFIQVLIAVFTVQILGILTPVMTQVVVDKVLVHRSMSTLNVLAIGIAIVYIYELILSLAKNYVFTHTTNRIDVMLSFKLFRHLFALPLKYFESRRVGETVARVRELDSIRNFLTGTPLSSMIDFIFIIVYIVVLFFYSKMLTVIVLCSIPVYAVLSAIVTPLFKKRLDEKFETGANTQSFLVESITGVQTVKSYALEPKFEKKWGDLQSDYVKASYKTSMVSATAGTTGQFIQKVFDLLILFFGAKAVMDGNFTVGQLVAFRMLSGRVSGPVLRLVQLWQEYQQASLSVKRIGDIFNTAPEPILNANQTAMPGVQGKIIFDQVHFRYNPQGGEVIKGMSFEIEPDTIVGVVGRSGSGKSTISKLIQRLYLPEGGKISIDGMDISLVNPAMLRKQIGVVLQENFMFNGTVAENISIHCPTASMEQIIHSAKIAGAHDFILELPNGYETIIGEKGMGLSGGQKQRVWIAMALAQDTKVLFLDEPTTYLDVRYQLQILKLIQKLNREYGITIVMVLHDINQSLYYSDEIVAMKDGRIIAHGLPEEIITKELVKEVYGVDLTIQSVDGKPFVIPV